MKNSFKHYQTGVGLAIFIIGSLAGQGIGHLLGGETGRAILGFIGFVIGAVVFVHMFVTQIAPYIEESVQYIKESSS